MDQQDKNLVQRFHAAEVPRGLESVAESPLFEGRFGRMFRNLPSFEPEDAALSALAAAMFEPEGDGGDGEDGEFDNPNIVAGITYLGQFIDHDLTFDPVSKLQRQNDPDALRDFRTPRFDLDSVYGRGPDDEPFIYKPDGIRFRIGKNEAGQDDLPRTAPDEDGESRRALTGDPRNDENVIVSQLHLAFLKYHNRVVDELEPDVPENQLFEEARRVVRWHYQWIVINSFLRTIVGAGPVDDILKTDEFRVAVEGGPQRIRIRKVDLKFFHWRNQPFMPVEFSVAAYRFGHSIVRPEYELNADPDAQDIPIFSATEEDLRGFRERPEKFEIEWHRFFRFPARPANDPELQRARLLDTKLAVGLRELPVPVVVSAPFSLAERNLLRGKALGLPSGQAVARRMGLPQNRVLTGNRLGLPDDLKAAFAESTPLWYYVLREAEVFNEGHRLGPSGGRIVAEVFLGILDGDPFSFLSVQPNWNPEPNRFGANAAGQFRMAEFLRHAGVTI